MARILKSESIHDATAPYVVSYSSRGPNHISPDILKVACYSMNGSGIFILVQFHRNLQFMQEINNFTPENDVISFFFLAGYNRTRDGHTSCIFSSGQVDYG